MLTPMPAMSGSGCKDSGQSQGDIAMGSPARQVVGGVTLVLWHRAVASSSAKLPFRTLRSVSTARRMRGGEKSAGLNAHGPELWGLGSAVSHSHSHSS